MPSHRHALITGTLFAAAAGLMWGLVFVAPLLLPQYPPAVLTFGRYLAFGLVALPLAWLDRTRLATLTRADWLEALKLGAVGNVAYYLFLSAAIQRAGAPLPTMLIGTLPVVIAVVANRRNHVRDGSLRWAQLAPSLLLMTAGIALVNQAEWAHFSTQLGAGQTTNLPPGNAEAQGAVWRYASGAALAVGAVICWTWYPLRNADWLRHHADRSATTWATAQGVATLPLALLGYAGWWAYSAFASGGDAAAGTPAFSMPLGPQPLRFVLLMVAIGLLASWLGTLCWNEASQRLPTALAGPLIVFETLAALAYAWMLRAQWPGTGTLLGVALLVAGVAWALGRKPTRSGV